MVTLHQVSTEKLITVSDQQNIQEALQIMDHYHIRHLPVLNQENDIVGLVSERDLFLYRTQQQKRIADIMKTELITFDVKAELKDVVESIVEHKISAVLVTRANKIVGIVTTDDLLKLLAKYLNSDIMAPTFLEDYILMFKEYLTEIKNPNYV